MTSNTHFWDGEYPNLNDISVTIVGEQTDMLTAAALGILYRLVWHFASRSVHSFYSGPKPDPLCCQFSKRQIYNVAFTSPREWAKVKIELEKARVLAFDGDQIRLLCPEFIRVMPRTRGRSSLPVATREFIASRDGSRCAYCADTEGPFHLDHIMPLAKGGSDDKSNLTVACATCNLSKGDKTLQEWMAAGGSNIINLAKVRKAGHG